MYNSTVGWDSQQANFVSETERAKKIEEDHSFNNISGNRRYRREKKSDQITLFSVFENKSLRCWAPTSHIFCREEEKRNHERRMKYTLRTYALQPYMFSYVCIKRVHSKHTIQIVRIYTYEKFERIETNIKSKEFLYFAFLYFRFLCVYFLFISFAFVLH